MNLANSLQFMHQAPKTISDGIFAYGVLNDYRADWALASGIEQLDMNENTIQRNPG